MMSGGNGGAVAAVESSGSGGVAVAPFVAKTYGMVDDPATDGAVAWGSAGNSFVVADPLTFSRALLPAHFNHSNFASFVRQLNTYGFRKVHPDRWEFAHASFLRGQTHLLRRIVRRRTSTGTRKEDQDGKDDSSTTLLAMGEVVRLKQEQRATEERLAAMWRRVQETERRPQLMLAFLLKAVGDPDALRHLAGGFHGGPDEGAGAKRSRLLLDDGEVQLAVGNRTMSSVDDGAGVDGLLCDIINPHEAFVPEPSVDFTGSFYAGADGFCDVLMVDGGAFPVDGGY